MRQAPKSGDDSGHENGDGPGKIHGPARRGPRGALSALGIVLTLALGWLTLRIEGTRVCAPDAVGLLAADEQVDWTFRRGLNITLDPCDGTAWSAPVTINREGLHDQEWPRDKRPGEARVLLLGGALADGVGVARGDRLSVRLAHLADQRRGERVSVINAQIPGYGPERQLAWLEARGLAWSPDVVVLVLDPIRTPVEDATLGLAESLPPASGLLPLAGIHSATEASCEEAPAAVRLVARPLPLPAGEEQAARTRMLNGIRRLADRAREAGAGFAVLVAPPCPDTAVPAGLCEEIEEIAPCADVGPSFASIRADKSKPAELCIDALGRWGRDGHFLASHTLWDLIARAGLWPDGVVRGYRL